MTAEEFAALAERIHFSELSAEISTKSIWKLFSETNVDFQDTENMSLHFLQNLDFLLKK